MWYSPDEMTKQYNDFKARMHNSTEEQIQEAFKQYTDYKWQEIEKCILSYKAGSNILQGGRFDTLSLGTWIEIFKAAKIPHVPAFLVGMVSLSSLQEKNFEFTPPAEMFKYDGMVRIDACGSQNLKRLSEFGYNDVERARSTYRYVNGKYFIEIDDRIAHSILTYVGQINPDGNAEHPIWWRPWVKARKQAKQINIGGYKTNAEWPIEWRAFVHHDELIGISNYYPQVQIEQNEDTQRDIDIITVNTKYLIDYLQRHKIQPHHPRYLDQDIGTSLCFTVDYISTPNGPAILEAGPAVPLDVNLVPIRKWGAHPCCFEDKIVSGIVLSK